MVTVGSAVWASRSASNGASNGDHQRRDRKSTRLNSSHTVISYAVFCLKKNKKDSRDHQLSHHDSIQPSYPWRSTTQLQPSQHPTTRQQLTTIGTDRSASKDRSFRRRHH